MTTQSSGESAETAESITDPESLRGRDDVAIHEDAERVDGETFDLVADLDNMAVVGVTNDDGEVLLMRVTEDCELKVPTASVAPGEDYAEAARQWVRAQTGFAIELDALEAAWHYEARHEDEERVASRYFVVFSASPATDGTDIDDPAIDGLEDGDAEAIEWFAELPDDAAEAPGTRLFFD